MPVLAFQRLDVYPCAVRHLALAARISEGIPKGYASLADPLRRAALSVPLNIAEGSGRTTRPDAARHCAIARGSAMECAAILDACRAIGRMESEVLEEANTLITRVVEMLTKMAR